MRVVIGASSFADADPAPLELLRSHGVEVVPNPYRRRMNAEEIVELLQDADGLLAGLEPLDASVLARAPKLRALARIGIGMDNVDAEFAAGRGIRVSNTPDAPTQAVVELALGALLSLLRNLPEGNESMHRGQWTKVLGTGLSDLQVFMVGYGRIGRRFGDVLSSLGARVLAHDPAVRSDEHDGVEFVTMEDGLARADVVSLHASGDGLLIDAAAFARMKDDVVLLNCARAGLVDESALIAALRTGKVAKAWLDVFWEEPYRGPLIEFPQVLMTPHVSTYSRQCRLGMETQAVRNLLRDLGLTS
jgi:D-3-phosphoglycerate dehydrogenase